jgi:hypothetical protein
MALNLLRGLEHFRQTGAPRDKRLRDAVETIRRARRKRQPIAHLPHARGGGNVPARAVLLPARSPRQPTRQWRRWPCHGKPIAQHPGADRSHRSNGTPPRPLTGKVRLSRYSDRPPHLAAAERAEDRPSGPSGLTVDRSAHRHDRRSGSSNEDVRWSVALDRNQGRTGGDRCDVALARPVSRVTRSTALARQSVTIQG